MLIDLGNRQWKNRRFTERDICSFLKTHNLLDVAKYFYNTSSIINPVDNRSLKEIYTSYYSSSGGIGTYNDQFLDYINAKKGKNCDFSTIQSLKFSLSQDKVSCYFNKINKSNYMNYRCTIPDDMVIVDELCWSDDSDCEIAEGGQPVDVDMDTSMAKIGYNGIIQCIRNRQSMVDLKRTIMYQDLVSKLESRLRVDIYNNSGLVYNIFFIDSTGLFRLLSSYISTLQEKLVKAHVTISDAIMIDDVFDATDSYIICFLDALSSDTSESHKFIVIVDTTLGYTNFGKNYSNIYHMKIDAKCCSALYFTHPENAEFDFLVVEDSDRSICIPFNRNDNNIKWLREWSGVNIKSVSNLNPQVMVGVDCIVKALMTIDKYVTCFLPLSLTDIARLENCFPNSPDVNKSVDLTDSKYNDMSVKYIVKSVVSGGSTCLYYNLSENNIQTHIEVDTELFNLLDQEISKYI